MPFIIGTAGHIDHGKTSLIKALTGMDTDRLKEEKERGISIDLGFAYLQLPDGTKAGIVDVPGHERFIRNMLAGATGIDLVLFVVAADDGIMPQTREHLDIMRLLGVHHGIFVITKTDVVNEGRVNTVQHDIKELVKDTCLKDSPVIPVSSATGFGMENLKMIIAREAKKVLPRPEGGFFRLPIDRSFSIKGFGTVVTGTVISGSVKKNDEVILISKKQMSPKKVKIRGMQSHFKEATAITAGQRAAVNLSGSISHTDIQRGDMLASADLDMMSNIIDVSFEFLPVGTDLKSIPKPVRTNSILKLHHMTDETLAQVFFFDRKEAGPGVKTYGQIRLKEPMIMMRGDRFILRDSSINATIGGGKVLLSFAKKRKLTDGLEQFKIFDSQDLERILITLLSDKYIFGLDVHEARLMFNLAGKDLQKLVDDSKEIVLSSGRLILKQTLTKIEGHIIAVINKYHMDRPGDMGIDEDYILKEVRSQESAPAGFKQGSGVRNQHAILKAILDSLVGSGRIAKTGNVFHLPSYKPEAKGLEKEIEDAVLLFFSDKGLNPIKREDIFSDAYLKKCDKKDVERVFQLLLKRGRIVKITEDSFLSKDTLDKAKDKLASWVADKGKIKAAEFRDILGCGRKFAIELLEYFDKEKFTLRSGDYRILRKKPQALA